MTSGQPPDNERIEMIVMLIQQHRRNGFNNQDIRFRLRKLFDDSEIDLALRLVEQQATDIGQASSALKEENDFFGWYSGPHQEGDFHWPRLKNTLLNKDNPWTKEMIDSLDESSSLVVSHLAPPSSKNPIACKGLVLGYIQSGKTANFSATIAKAVDEGYKLIVVLAGMHNNLRKQTETRLREELVYPFESKSCTTLTSDEDTGDFKKRQSVTANRTLVRTDGFTLAVIKKNTSVLRSFKSWLSEASPEVLKACPVLIIDDESDQASVNTSKDDQDPTAINRHIRELVGLFNIVSYVGYTATPFANVFVNSDVEDDIYPKDFLITLEKPATYYGPEELFGRDAVNGNASTEGMPVIRTVSDEDAEILRNLERDLDGEFDLTDSMRSAIDSFLVAGTLRLSRGHWKQHITMLVHVSHLIDSQDSIFQEIQTHLDEVKSLIEYDDAETKSRLQKLIEKDFSKVSEQIVGPQIIDQKFFWKNLKKFVSQLEVIMDNSASDNRLSFDRTLRDGEPTWAIVVGGNTLSRGLTVEGLTTSFFVRGSKAYDTLLQMGRWFGYRKGYADLTRIFVTDDLFEFFYHLATVEQEIRDEIKVMAVNHERPIDVAVRIRRHPNLNITSSNKMRSAVTASVTYSGAKVQTRQIFTSNSSVTESNANHVIQFLDKISKSGKSRSEIKFKDLEQCVLYRGVSHELILQLLDVYKVPGDNPNFNRNMIQSYIFELNKLGELKDWSVALMSMKSGDGIKVGDLTVFPFRRTVKKVSKDSGGMRNAILRAVSTPGEELIDLADVIKSPFVSTDNILEPKDGERKSDTRLRTELRPKERGLLKIYPLQTTVVTESDLAIFDETEPANPLRGTSQLFGLSFVFPESSSSWGRGGYVRNRTV